MSVSERTILLVIIVCCISLMLGFLLKGRCLAPDAYSGPQYSELCYNDIQPLFSIRSVQDDTFPYIDGEFTPDQQLIGGAIEYPVLTGVFMWAAGLLVDDGNAYLRVTALLLAPFALVSAYVLARMAGRQAILFAASPAIVFYAFHNWDLLVVAATIAGLWSWYRGRPVWAAVWFGVGAALKLNPILLVAPLALEVWWRHRGRPKDEESDLPWIVVAVLGAGACFSLQQSVDTGIGHWAALVGLVVALAMGAYFTIRYSHDGRYREAVSVLVAGVGTAIGLNLPFMLVNFDGWWATYEFHRVRVPNFDSIWNLAASRYGSLGFIQMPDLNLTVAVVTLATFVVALAYGLRRAQREGVYPFLGVGAALLASFMLWNKVHSPQYTLWILPFFVLLNISWLWWAAYTIVDAVAYVGIFRWFFDIVFLGQTEWTAAKWAMVTSVWVRAALLLVLIVVFLRANPVRGPDEIVPASPA
jgi:uncharacterized membrane protein